MIITAENKQEVEKHKTIFILKSQEVYKDYLLTLSEKLYKVNEFWGFALLIVLALLFSVLYYN